MKYKFQSLYELDSLAVVNARDVGPVKNAFKILMFPDTRMYQAESPKEKVTFKTCFIFSMKLMKSILKARFSFP